MRAAGDGAARARSTWRGFLGPWLAFLLARALGVAAAGDVFFYGEELEKGTAAKAILDGIDVPYWLLPYHPYEGGGFVVSHLKALAFLLVGESLLAHKLVALATSSGVLLAGWVFARRHLSARAAALFGWLFVLAPLAFQKLSLLSLGIHFEAVAFVLLVLDRGLRLASAAEPRALDLALLGLVGGFGVYFSYQVALAVAWVALVLVARRRALLRPRPLALAALAFLIGFAPWLAMARAVGVEALLDIHGRELVPAEGGGLASLRALVGSLVAGPRLAAARLVAGGALFGLVIGAWAWRGSRAERGFLAYLGGFALLWSVACVRGGFVPPRMTTFLGWQRLAPLFGVALLALAGGLDRLLAAPRALGLAARVVLALLVGSGLGSSARLVLEGRLADAPANLRFLATTKGYAYQGYLAAVLPRRGAGPVERARPWLGFDERSRDLLIADLTTATFARGGGAAPAPGTRLSERVEQFARALGAEERPALLGAGPLLARAARRDLERELELVLGEPPERRALLARAFGRYGRDLAVSPSIVRAEVERLAGRPGTEPVLEGIGYRVFRRFVLQPYGGPALAAKPRAALEWIRGLPPAAQPALEAGFHEAWAEQRLGEPLRYNPPSNGR